MSPHASVLYQYRACSFNYSNYIHTVVRMVLIFLIPLLHIGNWWITQNHYQQLCVLCVGWCSYFDWYNHGSMLSIPTTEVWLEASMQKPCMVVLWKVPCCVCSVAYHWSYRNQSSVMGSFPRLNCCWRTTATASSARWVVMSESRWAGSSSSSLLWDRRMNKNQLTFIMMCALATIPTSRILHKDIYHLYCISLVLYHPAGYLLLPFFKSGIVSLKNFLY